VVNASLVRVHTNEGQEQEVAGDKVIIATGSRNLDLPSLPVDLKRIISSDDALNLDRGPESMLIVGGGVIGSELACIFQSFGSRVSIVEGPDRILPLPSVDQDMSKLMQREMKKRKIFCEVCRTAVKAEQTANGVSVTLGPSPFLEQVPASAKEEKVVEVETVLVTVGRVLNNEGLGLDEAGIQIEKKGWIMADEHCQTSQPGIYAIGDILGPDKVMLAHVASMEGLVAARNCLGQEEVLTANSGNDIKML